MDAQAVRNADGVNDNDVVDAEFIGKHRKWIKEVVYNMCDLLGMSESQQINTIAE